MSGFWNIVVKELRELLTKSTIVPILIMAVMFGMLGNAFGGIEEQTTATPKIGYVNEGTGVLANIAVSSLENLTEVQYNGANVDDGLKTVEDNGGTALLVIPSNFTTDILADQKGSIEIYWIMRGAGALDTISSTSVEYVLASVNAEISAYLVEHESSANASTVLSPTAHTDTTIFRSKEMNGISPGEVSNLVAAQSTMIPIVIMMIITMAGGTVVSSMGMEKENKTLETLLTLPVSRSYIIAGKLVASAIVGLLMAGIYMVGFNYYMTSLTGSSSIDLAQYGLTLGALDYVLIGLSLFASLLAALALCMVVGTFASNYKSAQTLTMPIIVLAMIPMFLTMMKDFNTLPVAGQGLLFAIPFSHPMMAFRSLMFDDYALVIAGIVYSALFAVAMIAIAVWIFKTDRLLTGRMGKKSSRRSPFPLLDLILSRKKA